MVVQARRNAATIVLIEDDPAVAQTMTDALDSSGYRVWHVATGSDARTLVGRSKPDLIVLDLMLPDIDGLVLCSGLKQMAPTPIVICSATNQKRDAILGLKLGADDFIPKPFNIDELEARLEAVLRRSRRGTSREPIARQTRQLRIGNLNIDPARRRAMVGTEVLALSPTEYRLISSLADRADQVVTRKDLALKVWGYQDPSCSRTIDAHIRRLRAKLSTLVTRPPAIVAVRGLGYKISSDSSDDIDAGAPAAHTSSRHRRVGPSTRRRLTNR